MENDLLSKTTCDVSLPICKTVFAGDRFKRMDRPFHLAFLVSIIEFGGQIQIDESTDHLLPGVPGSVMRSVARDLESQGLVSRSESDIFLTPVGLEALKDGQLPQSQHGTWVVQWVDLDSGLQVLSVDPFQPSIYDLNQAKKHLRNDYEGAALEEVDMIGIPQELFDSWHLALADGEEWSLHNTSSNAVSARTQDVATVRYEVLNSGVEQLSLASNKGFNRIEVESPLGRWLSDFVESTTPTAPSSVGVDELTDREVSELSRTWTRRNFSIGKSGVCNSFEISGIPVEPSAAEAEHWVARLITLLLDGVPIDEDWQAATDTALKHHPVLASVSEPDPVSVLGDLERRGYQFSDRWWSLAAALDWEIGTGA